ncbi:T9SS sorting signal type C domain-containing protein [uncultured Flavobacterium sp.]|uniref:T9SS sorting signal type C domain-containing protein n=1 Tax=uncultured Flavobacterium sp. TaxID=165435 RepID=UPI0030EB47F8
MKKSLQLITSSLRGKLFAKKLFTGLLLVSSILTYSQIDITPMRVNVAGFNTTWTDTDVTGTSDIRLLKATSNTVSPAMDFDSYTGEALNFKAKKQGSGVAAEYVITVSISIDNGSTWTVLGTRTPTSSTIPGDQSPFDISSYSGTQVKIRFSVAGTNDLVGVAIDNLKITGYLPSCTWDGSSWSNVVGPDEFTEATIAGAYSTGVNGDFAAKKLTIATSGSLVINAGTNVYVINEVVNNATAADFLIESNGNLVQIQDVPVNVNVGNMTVNRETSPLKYLDYVLWSSPVEYQYLQSFSPATLPNRFYTYNSATNLYAAVAAPSTTYFEKGNGYLIRTPDDHPTVPTIWASTFTGYPNNGNVSVAVTANTYNAVGNPYPSTLDADAFITDNGIVEALYFWRKENNSSNPSYATYTLSGGVANTAGGSALVPTYAIQVGQGFIAKSTSTSLNFTNSMRVADNDDLFFKSSTTVDKSRLWLDLTNASGLYCQTLIAYMPNATAGVDNGIDGRIFNQPANGASLTSIIGSDSSYIIQGKGTFSNTDVVSLAFKTAVAGNFTISLSNVDGLFANNAQDIFLKDNLTNTITNLTTGDYSFTTTAGDFLNRFEIVYQSSVLNVNNFSSTNVVVYTNNSNVVVNAGTSSIASVKIFDIRGRLLAEKGNVNASEVVLNVASANEVLLVQVANTDGAVVTKKVVN